MSTQFGQYTTSADGQYIEVDVHEPGSTQAIHLTLTRQEFDAAGERRVPAARSLDKISIDRIGKLHPKVRAEALRLFVQANTALTGRAQVRVVQGLRTFQEQSDLYAQGRTTRGPNATAKKPLGDTVTNARAGESYHCYGTALDFALLIDGKEISWDTGKDFDGDKVADWMEVVKVFKAAGWESGMDWKTSKDLPHLQRTFGLTWQQMKALHDGMKLDKDGYVIL